MQQWYFGLFPEHGSQLSHQDHSLDPSSLGNMETERTGNKEPIIYIGKRINPEHLAAYIWTGLEICAPRVRFVFDRAW